MEIQYQSSCFLSLKVEKKPFSTNWLLLIVIITFSNLRPSSLIDDKQDFISKIDVFGFYINKTTTLAIKATHIRRRWMLQVVSFEIGHCKWLYLRVETKLRIARNLAWNARKFSLSIKIKIKNAQEKLLYFSSDWKKVKHFMLEIAQIETQC